MAKARAYVIGLGLYEFYLNGEKQGDECLLPGFCDYDSWLQYQTYELQPGLGKNRVELVLGDGWYKEWDYMNLNSYVLSNRAKSIFANPRISDAYTV